MILLSPIIRDIHPNALTKRKSLLQVAYNLIVVLKKHEKNKRIKTL